MNHLLAIHSFMTLSLLPLVIAVSSQVADSLAEAKGDFSSAGAEGDNKNNSAVPSTVDSPSNDEDGAAPAVSSQPRFSLAEDVERITKLGCVDPQQSPRPEFEDADNDDNDEDDERKKLMKIVMKELVINLSRCDEDEASGENVDEKDRTDESKQEKSEDDVDSPEAERKDSENVDKINNDLLSVANKEGIHVDTCLF